MILPSDPFSAGSFSPAPNATAAFTHVGKPLHTSAADSPALLKLRKAAGEFESLLLSNLWKSMKSTFSDPDDASEDAAHDTIEDWGIDAMSSAVGKAGGFGISKLILKHLEPTLLHSQNGNGPSFGKDSATTADIPP